MKSTANGLLKAGFIVGLILGIVMVAGSIFPIIASFGFALPILIVPVCMIISAPLSTKAIDATEMKPLVVVTVFAVLGGNLISLIGAILAMVELSKHKGEQPVAEETKEETKAE